jgi:hypothetical protein
MLALAKKIARFTGNTKKVALVFVIVIVSISYGLFFYLQNNTENNIRNSLFEQQSSNRYTLQNLFQGTWVQV